MELFDNIEEDSEIYTEGLDLYSEQYDSHKDKHYILPLITSIKRYKADGTIVPFKIEKITPHGFVGKVSGLAAKILFEHMPWKYTDIKYWVRIRKQLIGKTFLGKILSININPLSIYINAAIPQFQNPEFIINHKYHGIILEKYAKSILLELGGSFNWKHGSKLYQLKKEHFASQEEFNTILPNASTEVACTGKSKKGTWLFINNTIPDNDITKGLLDKWIGKVVPVTVSGTDPEERKYLAQYKYNAIMKNVYPEHIIDEYIFTLATNNLLNTDTINCEIIQIDYETRCLHVKWIDAKEINKILRRTIPEDTEMNIFSLIPTNLLSHDLLLAEKTIRGNPTGSSERFPNSKAFTNAIKEARKLLKQNDLSGLDDIATWFQAESDWDLFTNKLWYDIRCRILAVIEQIRQEKHTKETISPALLASDE